MIALLKAVGLLAFVYWLWDPIVWPTLVLLLILIVAAFLRLLISTEKLEQKAVDVSKLKKGDVLLFGSNANLSSFPIKIANIITGKISSKYWTHAAIHLGDGNLMEATAEGVHDGDIDHYFKGGRLLKVYRHKYITDSKFFDKLVEFSGKTRDEKYAYDFKGLAFYVLAISLPRTWDWLILDNALVDRLLRLDEAYFCSEFVADAYKACGAPVSSFDSWRIKPADFITNPMFEEVAI